MATIDDDLAKSVTEGFRQAQIDIVNQDLILSGTGDVTVTLADGSKKTGPSWSKLITAANAAGTSAAAAKTSETNALASKNAAATSATNAATSEGNALASKNAAKTSENNAKTSETNAKTSENNAKTSETNAAASLAAAQLLTSVPYEAAPYPDVWVPFNDSLKMEGIAPYDTLTISGQMVELPSKSATFTRSTVATYIEKSGIMRNADINEPRFEKEGLLIEPQITNLYTYSEQWGTGSRVVTTNNSGDSPRADKTMALVVEDTATAEHYAQDRNITLTSGTIYCYSVFVKAHTSSRLLYLRVATGTTAGVFFDPVAGAFVGGAVGAQYLDRGFEDLGNGVYRVWMAVTAGATQSSVFRLQLAKDGVTASYAGDGKSGLYVWGAQLEDSPFPTSYIPTTAATVTRGADYWQIPKENCGYTSLANLFNRTLALEFFPKYFQDAAGYIEIVKVQGPSNDIACRWVNDNTLKAYRSSGAISVPCKKGESEVFAHAIEGNKVSTFYGGNTSSADNVQPNGTTQSVSYIGNSNQTTSVRFVYHIRNLRIWHRVLTLNQINGLR
ncbi:phage head spike fiber domain-containing protein [Leclercia barmai]|uniref:phage head spike fiber domain-containing protein n=1 Tax=Leclercia barmai TaxID=2785629 RepID=UPI003BB88A60